MLKIRVIPCLTVKADRLVKSVRFEEHRNIGSYVGAARVFNAREVDELILLDLDARTKGIKPSLLKEVTKECFMPLSVGGGVHSIDDFKTLLSLGADKVVVNTAALADPDLIARAARAYGRQCVVVSIDVRRGTDGTYEVFGTGGTEPSGREVVAWAQGAERLGAGEIFLTSIDRDGTMEGYDLDLIALVSRAVRIPVIVSGGACIPDHCVEAVKAGASAVAAASMFQYTHFTPQNVKEALQRAGIPARIN